MGEPAHSAFVVTGCLYSVKKENINKMQLWVLIQAELCQSPHKHLYNYKQETVDQECSKCT